MAILKVARLGHPVLRRRAEPVPQAEIRSDRIQRLIDDMFETMEEYAGIGLAAPQVHVGLRIFVAGYDRGPALQESEADVPRVALVNPELVVEDPAEIEDWEGCLSIPDLRGRVPRARRVVVRAFDRRGRRVELAAAGFAARVFQHEIDHLDGVLFLDRMRSLETLAFLDEFSRFWSRGAAVAE
ncbi:MAG TPA: peptide deformylase [Vicinamibacterales bacterium]|nr:peptide deformylase [Vicinamibacterales bacterium]